MASVDLTAMDSKDLEPEGLLLRVRGSVSDDELNKLSDETDVADIRSTHQKDSKILIQCSPCCHVDEAGAVQLKTKSLHYKMKNLENEPNIDPKQTVGVYLGAKRQNKLTFQCVAKRGSDELPLGLFELEETNLTDSVQPCLEISTSIQIPGFGESVARILSDNNSLRSVPGKRRRQTMAIRRCEHPHQRHICENLDVLKESMDATALLQDFIQVGIITFADWQVIEGLNWGNINTSQAILLVLSDRCSPAQFAQVLNVLSGREEHEYIVELLRSTSRIAVPSHLKVISTNLVFFQDQMSDLPVVIDHMVSERILYTQEKEEVQAKRTEREQIRCILEILRRKRETQFQQFLQILDKLDQSHVVQKVFAQPQLETRVETLTLTAAEA